MPNDDDEIHALREEIAKISTIRPTSTDLAYLTRRLADLKRQKSKPKRRRAPTSDEPNVVTSVSMPRAAQAATLRIADGEKLGRSDLIRRALAEYAAKHGYKAEIVHFGD